MMRDLVTAIVVEGIFACFALACILSTCGCNRSPEAAEKWRDEHEMCSYVDSVGYSDTEGWAGVILSNGRHAVLRYPVVGAQVCYRAYKSDSNVYGAHLK